MQDFLYCNHKEVEDLFRVAFPSAKIEDASFFAGEHSVYRTKYCFSLEQEIDEDTYFEELFKADLLCGKGMFCISTKFMNAMSTDITKIRQLWKIWIEKYPHLKAIWNERHKETREVL